MSLEESRFNPLPEEISPASYKATVEVSFLEQLVWELPHREEGINCERIKAYVSRLVLPLSAFSLFYKEELPDVVEVLNRANLEGDKAFRDIDEGSISAVTLMPLGLVMVMRNPMVEALNGSVYTEALLVHELVHAARKEDELPSFLEEGLADFVRGEYITQALPPVEQEALLKRLGVPDHLTMESVATFPESDSHGACSIRVKYLDRQPNDVWSYAVPAVAATGIEYLCRQDPKILDTLLASRTDPKAVLRLAELIDTVSPGLYSFLAELNYTQRDFARGLNEIEKRLGIGITYSVINGEPVTPESQE